MNNHLKIIDTDTIATINGIHERVMLLNNNIVEKGIEDITLGFEWSGNCCAVSICVVQWKDRYNAERIESCNWYYDTEIGGNTLKDIKKFIKKLEEKYGKQ